VLAFAFAWLFGEAEVDRAIAFERAREAASFASGSPADPELVSRGVQSTVGLLAATCLYGLALGGLFALAFAAAYGRVGRIGPRATATALALVGYAVLFLVPFLKYPANPPGAGDHETVARRTELYLAMIAVSLLAAVAAYRLGRGLARRHGARDAALAAVGLYLVAVALAAAILPGVHEVPRGFPPEVLWRFRLASLGTQAVLWAALGLGFGLLAERLLAAQPARARAA
jgi:predicted cobalt transporter CbtA